MCTIIQFFDLVIHTTLRLHIMVPEHWQYLGDMPTVSGEVVNIDQLSAYRVGTFNKLAIVVSLRADCKRQRTARIISGSKPLEHVLKVISWPPAEIVSCPFIDIDPVDARKHPPAPTRVLRFISRNSSAQHERCINTQVEQIVTRKGRGRTDNIASEAEILGFF